MPAFQLSPSMLQGPSETPTQIIDSALRAIREHLGMPIAYLSEFVGGRSVYRHVDAPGLESLIRPGDSQSLAEVYCPHILEGRLPEMIPDTSAFEITRNMPITRTVPIGSHLSIPIRLPDGTPYGMFCCLSPEPNPSLNHRDLDTMRLFANLAARQVYIQYEHTRQMEEKRNRIEDALKQQSFAIAYQPIVDLSAMEPSGYEALCRFAAEPYRSPDVWFDEAAAVGLSVELELASIQQAVSKLDQADLDVSQLGSTPISVSNSRGVIVDTFQMAHGHGTSQGLAIRALRAVGGPSQLLGLRL